MRIPLRRLTLLYGPNSGGKSSIISALLFLRQNLDIGTEFRFDGDFVRLGSFERSVYRHNLDRSVEIGWEVSGRPEETRLRLPGLSAGSYLVLVTDEEDKPCAIFDCGLTDRWAGVIKFGPGRLCVQHEDILRSEPYPGVRVEQLGKYEVRRWLTDRHVPFYNVANEVKSTPLEVSETRVPGSEIEAQSARLKDRQKESIVWMRRENRLLPTRADLLEDLEDAPSYAAPIQGNIGTDFELFGGVLVPWQVYLGLKALENILSSSDSILGGIVQVGPLRPPPSLFFEGPPSWAATKESQSRLADLVEKLGIGYRLSIEQVSDSDLASAYKVVLRDNGGTGHGLGEVGFGLSQILPTLGECVSRRNALICIQQPEEHLHPRLQAEVGEAIAGIIKDPELNNQLVVESHSETLILRIMKLVRQHRLTPEDVAVIYVHNTGDGCEAFELRLDEDGTFLDPWPEGFFEEGFRERFS